MFNKNYQKLQEYYQEKRFSLAYALCEKDLELKNTPEYQKMEQLYAQKFQEAQKKLLLNAPQEAKELLRPFVTINSKYPLTKLILHHHKLFREFLQAMAAKEYDKLHLLVKKEPILTTIPSYVTLQEELCNTFATIRENIFCGNTKDALVMLKKYEGIQYLQEEISGFKLLAKNAQKLLDAYEENNFIACYEIIDTHKNLQPMQLTQLLEKHWRRTLHKCKAYTSCGNIVAMKELLGEFVYISTRQETIKKLFSLTFLTKIHQELLQKNYATAENFIYSYLDIFGKDREIASVMKRYERESSHRLAIMSEHSSRSWDIHNLY